MNKHRKGCSWRVVLIAVVVIAAAVFAIDRLSRANWYRKCRDQAAEYISEGNYASALLVIRSNPDAFDGSALLDECVEKLPEQGVAVAAGKRFSKSSTIGSHRWDIHDLRELYEQYGGEASAFDTLELEGYITKAAEYIAKRLPGNAGTELLRLPEEEAYASYRALGEACNVLGHVLYASVGKSAGTFRTSAQSLDGIADVIPDAAAFAAVLRALDEGDVGTAWTLAMEIPFDGTWEHPIPDSRWDDILRYALAGGMKTPALNADMLSLARELFTPSGKTLSSFLNYCFTHRPSLKISNLEDAGKTAAGKVLLLGYENKVQLEMMALLDDAYYPESIEEVGIIVSWESGYTYEGYYGSNTHAEAKREWFTIRIQDTVLGTTTEKKLWAEQVPESIAKGTLGYTSRLSTAEIEAFLVEYLRQYSWMK